MEKVSIIIPTLWKECCKKAFKSLSLVPFQYRLIVVDGGSTWAEAVNIGIQKSEGDVLLMDDDITLLPDTFSLLSESYDLGDIFGFKLLFPDGRIQHGGGKIGPDGFGHLNYGDQSKMSTRKRYVPHCTASLLYIKRVVLDKVGGIRIFDGQQFEDVDFSMRALKAGFRIVYLPSEAIHAETATKASSPDFRAKFDFNYKKVMQEHSEFIGKLGGYPIEI